MYGSLIRHKNLKRMLKVIVMCKSLLWTLIVWLIEQFSISGSLTLGRSINKCTLANGLSGVQCICVRSVCDVKTTGAKFYFNCLCGGGGIRIKDFY